MMRTCASRWRRSAGSLVMTLRSRRRALSTTLASIGSRVPRCPHRTPAALAFGSSRAGTVTLARCSVRARRTWRGPGRHARANGPAGTLHAHCLSSMAAANGYGDHRQVLGDRAPRVASAARCLGARRVGACGLGAVDIEVSVLSDESAKGAALMVHHRVPFPPGLLLDGKVFSYGRLSERRLRRELDRSGASRARAEVTRSRAEAGQRDQRPK